MSELDRLGTVLDVACQTEDRTGAEQRAMLDLALRVDLDRGKFTTTNPKPAPPEYVARVVATWHPSAGRRVALTRAQLEQYRSLAGRWVTCPTCRCPMGAHYENERCPR